MKKMCYSSLSLAFTLFATSLSAQIITTDPAIPTANQPVTVFYDATLGTGGLQGFTGDVYAHTGLITSESISGSDWKYAPDWGDNSEKYKLTRISTDLFSLEITPSIQEYYGVADGETILRMAFVFRSADTNLEGKDDGGTDIFVDVFEEGLNISIINPAGNLVTDPLTDVPFEASASEEAMLTLYLNGSEVKNATASAISHTFNFADAGDYWLKVTATLDQETVADSVFVHAKEAEDTSPLPQGVQPGINYIDDQTVTLALWAPGKSSTFVVGDFNNWTPATASRMSRDDDTFWITLTGLTPGEEYAFQYLVDANTYIADPYTDKVLDPMNDRWINDQTYPDVKPYPNKYATGIVSVLQTDQQHYEWQVPDFTPPAIGELVIYELLVRDFIENHDWQTLTDTLDYLTGLGINAIELMPFNEFEGNESWGYNPSFYFAPDKYYGPKDDLKAFIDACHSRGIAVIQDMVLNHSYSQSPLVQLYFNGKTFQVTEDNPWYNVESPNSLYSWGYDFDHESQATKDFVDRVNEYWLTEYNVDGFRFDFTKGFTNTPGDGGAYDAARIAILKRMSDQIWSVNPDAYVILEHFAANSEEKELSEYGMMIWGNINHNYRQALKGAASSNNIGNISYLNRGWTDPHLVGYMESHDEERLMVTMLEEGAAEGSYNITSIFTALDRMKLGAAFFFTIPGPKMIWQFGEVGYDFSIDYNGRVGNKPIRWDYYRDQTRLKVYDYYAALIQLKTSEPAFSSNDFNVIETETWKRIELNHSDMDVRVIGNFGLTSQSISPNFSQTGTWYNFFGGTSIEVTDVNEPISLRPGAFIIYTTKQLQKPKITSIEKSPGHQAYREVLLYPVPANSILSITSAETLKSLEVYNSGGQKIHTEKVHGSEADISLESFNSGIYILKANFTDSPPVFKKFIKE